LEIEELLTDNLNPGKKYCPYFKAIKKKELNMFNQEITQLFIS